jgi:hypothetical protein
MTVYVLEYLGMAWLRAGASGFPAPESPAVAVTVISSAGSTSSLSTIAFSSATELIELVNNSPGGGASFFFQVGSSLFGASSVASTNSEVVLANSRVLRGVPQHGKLIGWSS